jgi:oligosaccharide repeat unit polymerase
MAIIEGFFRRAANRKTGLIIGLVVGVIGFQLVGMLASLRTLGQNQRSGLEEVLSYYEYPGMNIEEQCRVANGLGPWEMKPLGMARFLLPFKLLKSEDLFGDYPPTIEPSSPSGFYQLLQWDLGPIGIIMFSLLCGIVTQHVYQHAHRDNAALLTYCLIAWALFSSALYNHFLNLLFLPLPAFLFWSMSSALRLLDRRKRAA